MTERPGDDGPKKSARRSCPTWEAPALRKDHDETNSRFPCRPLRGERRPCGLFRKHEGTWPKSWPTQMEPLRKQARSLRGSLADITLYEIPFTKRAEFEAAWPHILKVKTKGAPVILVRSPDTWMGRIDAGVRIHCPPGKTGEPVTPGTPIAGAGDVTTRWLYTNYIELIVDGNIVD